MRSRASGALFLADPERQRPAGPGEARCHSPARSCLVGQGTMAHLPWYPRPCRGTICRQHANCFNLVSDPPRGSPHAAGAMDVIQEQLKRGREPDPQRGLARRAEILGRQAPRRPLTMDPLTSSSPTVPPPKRWRFHTEGRIWEREKII